MDILLVEDRSIDRLIIEMRLRRAFPTADLMVANDSHWFREHLRRPNCDVVVTDYWLGWSGGLSVLQRVRERWPGARVIILTANGGKELVADAFKFGVFDYLVKPDGFSALAAVTRAAFEDKRQAEVRQLRAASADSMPAAVHHLGAAGIVAAIGAQAGKTMVPIRAGAVACFGAADSTAGGLARTIASQRASGDWPTAGLRD